MTAVSDDPRLTRTGPNGYSPDDVDLARLFGELKEESRLLVTTEVELAKAEMNEAKGHLIKGVVGYAAAAVLGLLAVVLLSSAAAWAIAEAWSAWAGFLIVGGVWLLAAVIAFTVGRSALERFDPIPHRTIQTLKEDARWVRTLIS